MQTSSTLKIFLIAGFVLCIISCNNSKKDKAPNDKPADTAIVAPPPVNNPADTAKPTSGQKCYRNDGLKYVVIVTIDYMSATEFHGQVMSQEHASGKKDITRISGVVDGDQLKVTMLGSPPVVGDASEWTKKPWTIDRKSGEEKLRIVFNAKNYETHEWADTDYEFVLTDCK